jgi:hypothetical protein
MIGLVTAAWATIARTKKDKTAWRKTHQTVSKSTHDPAVTVAGGPYQLYMSL